MKSPDNELLVTEPLIEKNYKRLETVGIRKSGKDLISYRLVKVTLPTDEIEILMNNLNNTFTISDLAEIYCLH